MDTVTKTLRRAIRSSGDTRYRIAQGSGIHESVLSRFMAGKSLRGENIDKLATYFGMELVAKKSHKSAAKGR